MAMGTPKKPISKKVDPKSLADDEDDNSNDHKPTKKIEDDEDDFDGPLDDLGYESFNDYDDDDDF